MDFESFYKVLSNVITKNDNLIKDIEISADTYDQYLITRYLSFYHPALLDIVNEGLNSQTIIPNRDDVISCYKHTKSLFPQFKKGFVKYHKKKVSEKIKNLNISEEDINLLAQKKEMSVRELKEILKFA